MLERRKKTKTCMKYHSTFNDIIYASSPGYALGYLRRMFIKVNDYSVPGKRVIHSLLGIPNSKRVHAKNFAKRIFVTINNRWFIVVVQMFDPNVFL